MQAQWRNVMRRKPIAGGVGPLGWSGLQRTGEGRCVSFPRHLCFPPTTMSLRNILSTSIFLAAAAFSATIVAQTYSGPITITAGGTYSGNWQSTDPKVPAVTVNTSSPVTIQNANIRSAGDCIHCGNTMSHNLTVQNVYGYGLNPLNTAYYPGRFIHMDLLANLVVQNCYMEGTSGIGINGYSGNHTAANSIVIRYNHVKNIDGRHSLGAGGGYSTTAFYRVQFVQIGNCNDGIPGMEIAWNEVFNEPYNSRVEDNINIYNSGGASSSNLLIHDNYIQGAYPAVPGTSYSGGGIITDGGATTNPNLTPAFVNMYNNQVVATGNYGLSISTGHDNLISNNRVVSTGFLADGATYSSNSSASGITNWDPNNNTANGTFFNNHVKGNVAGLEREQANGSAQRADFWLPAVNEYSLNSSFTGTLDHNAEVVEFNSWKNKLLSNAIQPGPTKAALFFQTETLSVNAISSNTHRIVSDPSFNGYFGTVLDGTAVGNYVTYLVPGVPAGTYDVRVGVKDLNTRGIFQLAIGKAGITPVNQGAPQDLYNSGSVFTELDLGNWTPASSSDKYFQFTVTGKNASSTGYTLSFDYIELVPQ